MFKRLRRFIKKILMPDYPPETYNRADRRTKLRDWERRQMKKDRPL